MSDIYFSNLALERDTEYFLYIGELKNFGLNLFLKEALSRIFNRRFDFISIIPDVFEQYDYPNLLVINPLSYENSCRHQHHFSCRVRAGAFMTWVSQNQAVRDLIAQLQERQEQVYIYMYESRPEMTLDQIPGVVLLGPDSKVAAKLNNKIYQYEQLQPLVPLPQFYICQGYTALAEACTRLWEKWPDGIFVSLEYSAAGVNSIIAHQWADIETRFRGEESTFFISRYIPHAYDPTVLAVVANEQDVYVAGIADQRIDGGTRFIGSIYPSVLPPQIQAQLRILTRQVGGWLATQGYRGIFGCDFIVTPDQEVLFIEVNARKQGTTLEFACTLEQSLPDGSAMLPEIEYFAVVHQRFPENIVELQANPLDLHWGTYNYKLDQPVHTNGYIPQQAYERAEFAKVACKKLQKDFLILEHVGSDFIVAQGSFLARVVALGHDHESVQQGLNQGKRTIALTIDEKNPHASD